MELEIVKKYNKNSHVKLSYKVKSKIDKMKTNDFEYLLSFLDYKDIFKVVFINKKFKKSIFKLDVIELFKHLVEHKRDLEQLLTCDAALLHYYMTNINLNNSTKYYDSFCLYLYQYFKSNSDTLVLNDIHIGNKGLYVLSKITFLKHLDLGSNAFTDDNSDAISNVIYSNKNIETLILSNNKLTDIGSELIIQNLSLCKDLKKLDLKGNHISFNSLRLQEHFEKLLIETSIFSLNLSFNKINDNSFNKISNFLLNSTLREMNVSNNSIRNLSNSFQSSNYILINSALEVINFASNKLSNFEIILDFINNLSHSHKKLNLREIDLSDSQLSETSLSTILEFSKKGSLKKLNICKNNLNKMSIFIAELIIQSKIDTLIINSCKLDNESMSNMFSRLNTYLIKENNFVFSIRELDIGGNIFKDESLILLSNFIKLSKLKVLSLAFSNLEDSQFNILSKDIFLSELESINISYNSLSNIDGFVDCYEKYLMYNFKALDHIKYNLKSFNNILNDKIFRLKEINLSYNDLGDEGVLSLFNLIAYNSVCNLSSLNLKSNNLTDKSATIISSAIIYNDKFEKLNIESNNFTVNYLKDILNAAKIGKIKELRINQNNGRKKEIINQSLLDQKIEISSSKKIEIYL